MIDVGAAVKSAEELDKAVGIVAKVIGKLKAKPDLAAQKLIQALGEVAKTLQVVDNAAVIGMISSLVQKMLRTLDFSNSVRGRWGEPALGGREFEKFLWLLR